VLAIGYHTGMRRREILTLKWDQVDFFRRVIRLRAGETKNDEGREIPIVRELEAVLRAQRAKRPEIDLVCYRVTKNANQLRSATFARSGTAGVLSSDSGALNPPTLIRAIRSRNRK
jgi:integrase